MSDDINKLIIGQLWPYVRSSKCIITEDIEEIFAAAATIEALRAENERLRDENKRLRELVEGLEEELKEAGAVAWRTPDETALDADLLREDAHERQRLEKEYPWKE